MKLYTASIQYTFISFYKKLLYRKLDWSTKRQVNCRIISLFRTRDSFYPAVVADLTRLIASASGEKDRTKPVFVSC